MLTFKQFLLEYELILPKTEYGYWIDTQGTFFPVGYQDHSLAAEKLIPHHLKEKYPHDSAYDIALKIGWVRVYEITHPNEKAWIGIQFQKTNSTTHTAVRYYLYALKDKYFNREVDVRITYRTRTTPFDDIRRAIVSWAQYRQ